MDQINERAVIGGNNPPSEFELFAQELTDRNKEILNRAANLIAVKDKLPKKISDTPNPAETAEKLTTLVKQITTCYNQLEKDRMKEKRPFMDKEAMVDTFFKANTQALAAIKESSLAMLKVHSDELHAAEQKRLREEAERQNSLAVAKTELAVNLAPINVGAAEAALEDALASENMAHKYEAAAEKTTGLVAIRSASGATAARRTVKTIKVVDLNKLDLEKLRFLIDLQAYQKAANAFLRQGGTELAGCVIEETTDITVR